MRTGDLAGASIADGEAEADVLEGRHDNVELLRDVLCALRRIAHRHGEVGGGGKRRGGQLD